MKAFFYLFFLVPFAVVFLVFLYWASKPYIAQLIDWLNLKLKSIDPDNEETLADLATGAVVLIILFATIYNLLC